MSKLLELLGPGIQLRHLDEGGLKGKDLLVESYRIRIYDTQKEEIIFTVEKDNDSKLYNLLNSL
jgi:hypothetical protein